MGREVRKVAAGWSHPTDTQGRFIPLHSGSLSADLEEWEVKAEAWGRGFDRRWDDSETPLTEEEKAWPFSEAYGASPVVAEYMPDWGEEEATHFMLYENVSEGTPVSPAFFTEEELARWLADHSANLMGHAERSYESWLGMVKSGYAPSFMISRPSP